MIMLAHECGTPPEIKEVPVTVYVKVPIIQREFDTIENPYPVKVVVTDSFYYKEYLILKDSLQRDSLARDALAVREYNNSFEDTVQTIDVFSRVRGHLLDVQASYVTKPFTVRHDTVIPVKIPRKHFALGLSSSIPATPESSNLSVWPEMEIMGKKANTTIGYDFFNKDVKIGYKLILW